MTTVADLDKSVWDCPLDLKQGERIVLYETFLGSEWEATVEDVIGGILTVRLDSSPLNVSSVNPLYTAWHRKWAMFLWDVPKVEKYGATCSDPNCYVKYFPNALDVPGFKCYSCRTGL